MKKFKVSTLFDTLLFGFLGFIVIFVWIRYFVPHFWLSVLISIVLDGIFIYFARLIKSSKQQRQNVNKALKADIDSIMASFLFGGTEYCLNFFKDLIHPKQSAEVKNGIVLIKKPNKMLALVPCFENEKIGTKQLTEAYTKCYNKNISKLIICCIDCDKATLALSQTIKNIEIIILDKNGVYFSLLKPYNTYPEKRIEFKNKGKAGWKLLFENALSRNKFKHYIFSGILILFCSFFMYTIYYVIMSSLLFTLAAICLLKKRDIPLDLI